MENTCYNDAHLDLDAPTITAIAPTILVIALLLPTKGMIDLDKVTLTQDYLPTKKNSNSHVCYILGKMRVNRCFIPGAVLATSSKMDGMKGTAQTYRNTWQKHQMLAAAISGGLKVHEGTTCQHFM